MCSYEFDTCSKDLNTDFTLGNCLFEAAKLTKNADPDKYGYNGYGIGFNVCSQFSWSDGSWDKNVFIFGVDSGSSVHADNKKKNILVLGEVLTQGLDNTTITAEAKHPTNFTESKKRLVLRLNYNGSNSFLFVNAVKCINLKQKIQK